MIRTLIYILLAFFGIVSIGFQESSAAVTQSYIPAPIIVLTGTTTDVRFDVATPLAGTPFSGAYLDTVTRAMSGVFYMNSIGWAMMSTGSYQVLLDCGGQSLDSLSSQCSFVGSGWSENIGELDFSAVRYNPATGTLTGSISSFAGNFSVVGTSLPLRPAVFNQPLTGLTAHHAGMLSVQNANRYGDGAWSIRLLPSALFFPQLRAGGAMGMFAVDLSFADTYIFELTDPQGSITRYSGVEVGPAQLNQAFDSTSTYFISNICTADPTLNVCVGRDATKLTRTPSAGTAIADGVDGYDVTLLTRDTYGNHITTGTIDIAYTGTVSAVQIPSIIMSNNYDGFREQHDALIITGDIFPGWDLTGKWSTDFSLNATASLHYHIASVAPTDTTDNIIVLDTMRYTAMDGSTSTIFDASPFVFTPTYTHTINPPTNITIGSVNVFQGNWASHTTTPLTPDITTLLLIGSGNLADIKDIESNPVGTPNVGDTDWLIDYTPTSTLAIPNISANFTFSGTYAPRTAYPEIESLSYYSFVHYVIGGIDVVYPLTSGTTAPAEYNASRIKILGQNNARSEYGTISTDTRSRTDFFNTLRKNITLLSRNRATYTDTDYDIIEVNTSVDNASFDTKKTIIVIGGDVNITANIDKDPNSPLAIIALADAEGNGGNINIDASVTDISAGLFAEHAILTTGDSQLYIYGALVSANTLGDTAAGICPYFVSICSDPATYDLEYARGYDGSDISKRASNTRAGEYPGIALIIEYDMRLQTNPPPGLPR